jgi:SAM-dependent methyltransferase
MPVALSHQLKAAHDRDSLARQDFISSLRGYILNDMATGMQARFEGEIEPAFARQKGRPPQTQDEVHAAMRKDVYFKFYSSVRYNAQEMVWRSVIPGVQAALPELTQQIETLSKAGGGSLTLDAGLDLPENVAGLDVHLMPGGYANTDTPAAGAVYDNGLAVFSAGFMGPHLDDIGLSMSNFVKHRFPDFAPERILDCGCTVGHNAAAWASTFPDAAHGRAQSLGLPVHYHQMDATSLGFEDVAFDVVFTSMFLHELSVKDIKRFIAEAYRVLRPGGMLINMELPPNRELKPYDQFYLDWDSYYNKEPFYRAFRDQQPEDLIQAGGFDRDDYFQFSVPQFSFTPLEHFVEAVNAPPAVNGETGRLSASLNWFGFGARKPAE